MTPYHNRKPEEWERQAQEQSLISTLAIICFFTFVLFCLSIGFLGIWKLIELIK